MGEGDPKHCEIWVFLLSRRVQPANPGEPGPSSEEVPSGQTGVRASLTRGQSWKGPLLLACRTGRWESSGRVRAVGGGRWLGVSPHGRNGSSGQEDSPVLAGSGQTLLWLLPGWLLLLVCCFRWVR